MYSRYSRYCVPSWLGLLVVEVFVVSKVVDIELVGNMVVPTVICAQHIDEQIFTLNGQYLSTGNQPAHIHNLHMYQPTKCNLQSADMFCLGSRSSIHNHWCFCKQQDIHQLSLMIGHQQNYHHSKDL